MHAYLVRLTRGFAFLAVICASLGLAARPAHAQAGFYTYTLSNAPFNFFSSTGSASGYFDYDPTTGQFGDFDITTTDGTDMFGSPESGNVYDAADQNGETTLGDGVLFVNNDGDAFAVNFETPSPSPSATELAEIQEGTGSVGASSSFDQSRAGLGDTLTVTQESGPSAVPELSSAACIGLMSLLGVGALGLAGAKRRRVAHGGLPAK